MRYAIIVIILLAGCSSNPHYLKYNPTTGEYKQIARVYPDCSKVTLVQESKVSKAISRSTVCEIR